MAADHATSVDSEDADGSTAYVSPAVDFLLLLALTAPIALAGAAVIFP